MVKINKNMLQFAKLIGIVITIFITVAFVTSAYGGKSNPMSSAKMSVIGMTFPLFLMLVVLLIIVWLCLRQWVVAAIPIVAVVLCLGPIFTFFPVNIFSHTITSDEKPRVLKVLTYNVMNFTDYGGVQAENSRSMQYILDVDADIVCIQEGAQENAFDKNKHIKPMLRAIKKQYPYYTTKTKDLVLLSKYPFKPTADSVYVNKRNKVVAYKVDVDGREVTVINCHLESIGLTETDKDLYWKLTQLKEVNTVEEMKDVRGTLVSKLVRAFRRRASQAVELRHIIDKAGENVIVCGDFNDTPGLYSYRTVMGDDMSDAYLDCAFGPTITYHSNRFFFKIDHMMYRGNMKAVDIKRGNINSSDHYPLFATYVWKD